MNVAAAYAPADAAADLDLTTATGSLNCLRTKNASEEKRLGDDTPGAEGAEAKGAEAESAEAKVPVDKVPVAKVLEAEGPGLRTRS